MANIWHSSAVLFLIKNKLLPIISPHLSKDNNFIDFNTFTFIDEKLQKIIRYYFTIDNEDVSNIYLYKNCYCPKIFCLFIRKYILCEQIRIYKFFIFIIVIIFLA